MKLELELSKDEVSLLRNCISDLGTKDKNCLSLQLKIANAILDSTSKVDTVLIKE